MLDNYKKDRECKSSLSLIFNDDGDDGNGGDYGGRFALCGNPFRDNARLPLQARGWRVLCYAPLIPRARAPLFYGDLPRQRYAWWRNCSVRPCSKCGYDERQALPRSRKYAPLSQPRPRRAVFFQGRDQGYP